MAGGASTAVYVAAYPERTTELRGGGSTSLVTGGRLVNRPEPEGRPVSTALLFLPR